MPFSTLRNPLTPALLLVVFCNSSLFTSCQEQMGQNIGCGNTNYGKLPDWEIKYGGKVVLPSPRENNESFVILHKDAGESRVSMKCIAPYPIQFIMESNEKFQVCSKSQGQNYTFMAESV